MRGNPEIDELENEIVTCRLCPRLVSWREEVARVKRRAFRSQEYWGKPVPGFGDLNARVAVVGLAPGAHGSNRTGRMFTGDASGVFLYQALYEAGFSNLPASISREDDLRLSDLFITALCRCVPPDNKPLPEEIVNCQPFLKAELNLLKPEGVVALGKVAFDQIIRLYFQNRSELPNFSHGVIVEATENTPWILGSYHPSRQNTQTGRLTMEMFAKIWEIVRLRLSH